LAYKHEKTAKEGIGSTTTKREENSLMMDRRKTYGGAAKTPHRQKTQKERLSGRLVLDKGSEHKRKRSPKEKKRGDQTEK